MCKNHDWKVKLWSLLMGEEENKEAEMVSDETVFHQALKELEKVRESEQYWRGMASEMNELLVCRQRQLKAIKDYERRANYRWGIQHGFDGFGDERKQNENQKSRVGSS